MARSEVRGQREVARTLRGMASAITPAVKRQVAQDALEPMQDLARQNFVANGSMKTGVIPQNIVIVHSERESKLTMSGTGASLGHLIELGTDPHEQPNRGIVHPGAEPKPFMRPAFDEGRATALQRAKQTVWAALAKVAGRR